MKKLLLTALLIPTLSFGQRFEISEQAGADLGNGNHVFCNAAALGYHPLKHFSISAFYESGWWKGTSPFEALYDVNTHAYGIGPDADFRWFFAGIDAKVVYLRGYSTNIPFTIVDNFGPSIGWGYHVGSKQKITKHLQFVEQMGYEAVAVKGSGADDPSPQTYYRPFTQSMNYYYLRVGLCYRI